MTMSYMRKDLGTRVKHTGFILWVRRGSVVNDLWDAVDYVGMQVSASMSQEAQGRSAQQALPIYLRKSSAFPSAIHKKSGYAAAL
jgi:hypothetical protein